MPITESGTSRSANTGLTISCPRSIRPNPTARASRKAVCTAALAFSSSRPPM